jgi:hypothetical protein
LAEATALAAHSCVLAHALFPHGSDRTELAKASRLLLDGA